MLPQNLFLYSAFLYVVETEWLILFLFYQLIMSRRRIPCLDSYLDKVINWKLSEQVAWPLHDGSNCYTFLHLPGFVWNEFVQVNISLWPRFKMVFDMHVNSLRNANMRSLWEDDVHPHYVMRRYAEFTASLIQLNVDYGDGQVRNSRFLFQLLLMVTLTIRVNVIFICMPG